MATNPVARGWLDDLQSNDLNVGRGINFQLNDVTYWDLNRDAGDLHSFAIHHVWQANPALNADTIFVVDSPSTPVGIRNNAPSAQLHVSNQAATASGLIVNAAVSQSAATFVVEDSGGGAWFTVDSDGTVRVQAKPLVLSDKISVISNKTMTIMAGTGVPATTEPSGSLFLRTDGGVGSRFYVSQGAGSWIAATGL